MRTAPSRRPSLRWTGLALIAAASTMAAGCSSSSQPSSQPSAAGSQTGIVTVSQPPAATSSATAGTTASSSVTNAGTPTTSASSQTGTPVSGTCANGSIAAGDQGQKLNQGTWSAAIQLAGCGSHSYHLEAYPTVVLTGPDGKIVPITVHHDPASAPQGIQLNARSPICVFLEYPAVGSGTAQKVSWITVKGSGSRPAVSMKVNDKIASTAPVTVSWAASSGECLGSN
jgi:hypothetical protein